MRITVFTSNQPRHLALIEQLSAIASEVIAVQECTTLFPGQIADFYKKTEVMQRYFKNVMAAEGEVFGRARLLPKNVRSLVMKMGDLNGLDANAFSEIWSSDIFVVFGTSFIKGSWIDRLIEGRCLNIHMGISPYYRGNSCNFWALYDGRPEFVGATIHLLSRGLDSGAMLFHALPSDRGENPFVFGMRAVEAAQEGLVRFIEREFPRNKMLNALEGAQIQDKSKQLRYTKNADFNDSVALEFLNRELSVQEISKRLQERDLSLYLNPFVF